MAAPKPDTAFRTISEASDEIGVPQHVLRFWETRFAQLQPLKRGGNRRYYRPADMELLRTIRALLHDQGLTIRGAQLALAKPVKAGNNMFAEPIAPPPAMPPVPLAPPSQQIDLAQLRAIRDRLRSAIAA
jgi:DNA-binding transcriptional MerR regulator